MKDKGGERDARTAEKRRYYILIHCIYSYHHDSYPASLATFLDDRKGWARILGIVGRRVGFLRAERMREV